jgi:hypothetical protein
MIFFYNYHKKKMPTKRVTLVVSSDPALGAKNINSTGSEFDVDLIQALEFPKDTVDINIRVLKSSFVNNFPNIFDGTDPANPANNKVYVVLNSVPYTLTIPKGSYDIYQYNSTVQRLIEEEAALPNGIIAFIGDVSTQKVIIQYNELLTQVDFTQADTSRLLLGFDSRLSPPAETTTTPEYDSADNVARFGDLKNILISCNIVSMGIPVNARSDSIISISPINVPTGNVINDTPFNPLYIDAMDLTQKLLKRLHVRLLGDDLQLLDTNGEYFSFTIEIIIETKDPVVTSLESMAVNN